MILMTFCLSTSAPASANFPVSEQVLTKWQGTFYSKEKRQISLLPYSDVLSFMCVVRESQLLSFSRLSSKITWEIFHFRAKYLEDTPFYRNNVRLTPRRHPYGEKPLSHEYEH